MSEVTVQTLAKEIDTPVDRLLKQFQEAGMQKSANDQVSQDEKTSFVDALKARAW